MRAEAKAAAKEEAERIKAELIEKDAKAKALAEKEAKKGKGKKINKKEEAAPTKQETPKQT